MLKIVLIKILKILSPAFLLLAFPWALFVRYTHNTDENSPKLVWGPISIINNHYWSRAMKDAGFDSETYTFDYFPVINKREDWDILLKEKYRPLPLELKVALAFLEALKKYDVFFIPFTGFFLGLTPLWRFEAQLLKLAGKKIVVLAYGGDAYAYSKIRSTGLNHAILMSYPEKAREEAEITQKVEYWKKHADVIMSGWMYIDGIGRWDILMPSFVHIDTDEWVPNHKTLLTADGIKKPVTIVHAPNHRGFKGTEFIIDAIEKLKKKGLKINFILLEKKQNEEVKKILTEEADILVEQLILTGHGLNGLEGMASGITVVSNLEDENYSLPFRRWSFLSECPIVSATPENLENVLEILITNPKLRKELGKAGRKYTEKYHSLKAAQHLYGEIIKYLYNKRDNLITMFHPLLDEENKKRPKVKHPLINNKIPDKWQSKL